MKKPQNIFDALVLSQGAATDEAPHGWCEGIAVTPFVNRYGLVILPEAMAAAIPKFMENPVVSFGHDISGNPDGSGLPAGKALKLWLDPQGRTMFRFAWAPTPEAQKVRGLYQGKFMRGFSIQFMSM